MRAILYARYSTDMQREQSIDDQFRVAERLAERHGFIVVGKFSDRAISGGTTQRPGYQDLLSAVRQQKCDVIVAEDSSRLWRNLAEQAPRLAELSDLGVAVVTHDLDTRSESAAIMGAVTGAMGEQYRKEIGRRTRRGLEGLARAGKPAGGRAYGYIPAAQTDSGEIEIDAGQAKLIVRIFELYADGYSPRDISHILNREGVPSPGTGLHRQGRRQSGWVPSTIHGNPARGLGILNNDAYRGVVVWNRARWIRSARDSSKRRQIQNPKSEWIIRTDERLRIVPDELWKRVKARQAEQTHAIGARIAAGLSASKARRTGAGPKYLLSSLLRCAECGSSYAIAGRDVYACSGHTGGGGAVCTNGALLRRNAAEEGVLAGIKREMRSPEVIREICRRVRAALKAQPTAPKADDARIGQLRREIGNIADAIAGGVLRASPTMANRLAAAEAELERLTQAAAQTNTAPKADVEKLLAGLPALARRTVDTLEQALAAGDVPKARQQIRDHIGVVTVEADEREIRLYGQNLATTMVRAASGGTQASLCGSGGRI